MSTFSLSYYDRLNVMSASHLLTWSRLGNGSRMDSKSKKLRIIRSSLNNPRVQQVVPPGRISPRRRHRKMRKMFMPFLPLLLVIKRHIFRWHRSINWLHHHLLRHTVPSTLHHQFIIHNSNARPIHPTISTTKTVSKVILFGMQTS